MTLMKLRLIFFLADFSQDFEIYLVVFTLKFSGHPHGVRDDLES